MKLLWISLRVQAKMGYMKSFFIILAVTSYSGILCMDIQRDQTDHVTLEIDSSHIVFRASPALYSYGLGCSLDYQNMYNLSSPVLRRLAKELAPAYVRLGGTRCDFLTFRGDADGIQKEYKNKTLSGELWDALNDFTNDAGFRFIFDANVFLRTSDNKWNPSNFQELLKYNAKRGYKVDFQLGNEPNAFSYKFNKTITPETLAGDYKTLRSILKQSKFYRDSLVIGPDTTNPLNPNARRYLQGFVESIDDAVDVFSTHFYYGDPRRGETLLEMFTDPSKLDQFSAATAIYLEVVKNYSMPSSKPKMWFGESGLLPGGHHSVNISDRLISGMVWLDKLGICASNGIDVIVRETLISAGGGRRLIKEDEDVNADYWSAVLFKRLVGTESLKLHKVASGDGIGKIRVYAHCTQTDRSVYGYKPGAVTIFGANFNLFKAVRLQLNAGDVDQFLLTPARTNNVTSPYIALNGMELSLYEKGVLPDMLPQPVTSNPIFPAGSMGFFVLKDAGFEICKN